MLKPLSKEWEEQKPCKYAIGKASDPNTCRNPDCNVKGETRCPPIFYMRDWSLCDNYTMEVNNE